MGKRSHSAVGLWQYLNGRVEDLRELIPRTQRSWSRESIHQARVATRRLTAAIDLLQPLLTEKSCRSFAKALVRLRKSLGPLRDQDILLQHLQELKSRKTVAAVEWLARRVREQRLELQRKSTRKSPPQKMLTGLGRWWALEQEIKEVEPAARSLARNVVPGQLKSFTDRADQLSQARLSKTSVVSQDVHLLRIAGKRLRYTLELAEPLNFQISSSILKPLKKMQDALGLWHDYMVLGQEALRASLEDELPLHNSALHGQVLELAHICWVKSERYLDRFAQLWSESGESLGQQIIEIFALNLDSEAPRQEKIIVAQPMMSETSV